jgi:hypothetical protein
VIRGLCADLTTPYLLVSLIQKIHGLLIFGQFLFADPSLIEILLCARNWEKQGRSTVRKNTYRNNPSPAGVSMQESQSALGAQRIQRRKKVEEGKERQRE